jgi:hypothetical protein
MKVIVAGSRSITNSGDVSDILNMLHLNWLRFSEVVSGGAEGVDTIGELWADCWNLPVKKFPANWDKYGKSAGHIRNAEMADYADACVVIWDGKSAGSKGMIEQCLKKKLPLFVFTLNS